MKKREISFISESHMVYTCNGCGSNQSLHVGELCPSCKEKEVAKKQLATGIYSEKACSVCSGTGHNPFNDNACTYCEGTGKAMIKVRQKAKTPQFS